MMSAVASSSGTPGGLTATRHSDGSPARLLVAEDEELLADMLLDVLAFAGYDVEVAHTGIEALDGVEKHRPDVLLLDVNLPDLTGFAVAERLRGRSDSTPIIFLTARDTPADLRDGFLAGGDDYLTKPFRVEELRLRIEAVLRRTLTDRHQADTTVRIGDLVIDVTAHQVWSAGTEVPLSRTEFRLLAHLATHRDRVWSRADLLREVWGFNIDSDTSLVETYISYLRRKLNTDLIQTVRGVGYVIRTPASS
ncbi:two-component system OmpR family response regulator [Stackebrandtia endophytica]|uniref:Two-component system OmpR family response regulator n=2 Tax=Stackebrandtia endophytica TaxID=1496996 RepID=A0A543AV08_9ACTN|nr:two-component system OmpR family response regulator [Stackebrandtia endophytica]